MILERNIYRIILAACVGYILFLQTCGTRSCPEPQVKTVTVDTGYIIEQFKSTWQKPKPDTVIKRLYLPSPELIYLEQDPQFVYQQIDTAAILQDYFARVYYRDTLQTQYGNLVVEDTISQNRIQARRWLTNFSIPTVTKTVTLSQPPRNQLYVGFSGLMGQYNIGAEINLSLKTKRDQQYEVGAGLFGLQWYGRVGTKFKLTFK